MILKRTQSRSVLEYWSHLMICEPLEARDQGKLTEAVEFMDTKLCFLPSNWRHVQNQADLLDGIWFQLTGRGTFLHLASAKTRGKWKEEWNWRLKQKCNYLYEPRIPCHERTLHA